MDFGISRVGSPCPCGGDPFAPEHGLSPTHLDWLGVIGEKEVGFQRAVVTMAGYLGWTVYHTHDSRRSNPGFPDLVLVRDRVLFRELKTDKGRLTKEQEDWIAKLTKAGANAGVWRPRDWDSIEKELTK